MTDKFFSSLRSTLTHLNGSYQSVLVFVKPVTIASILVTSLTLGMRQLGWLQSLELRAWDQIVRLSPDLGTDPRLVVVAITEADTARYKVPISDRLLAQALAQLQQYQPRVIGLDVFRDLPQEPGHAELKEQFKASQNIIAITKIGHADDPGVPPPPGISEAQVGFNDVVIDPDGVVRRILMFADVNDRFLYAFSVQIALQYLTPLNILPENNKARPEKITWGRAKFYPLESGSGAYQTIDAQGYQTLLRYRTADNVAQEISLTELLEGNFPPELIRDKIVLIGNTAISSRDFFFTPYSASEKEKAKMAGVKVHAQMISHLLDAVLGKRSLFWFWSDWLEILWIGGWACLGGLLAWHLRHPVRLGLIGSSALGGLYILCFGAFLLGGWIPWIAPSLTLIGTIAVIIAYKPLYDALHDRLTGLPNGTAFINRVAKSVERARQGQNYLFAVLFLDLDRFKFINESLGHGFGDQLLNAIAYRLTNQLHFPGMVARIGGDEFSILLEDVKSIVDVTQAAEELQQFLAVPFNLNEQEVFVTASIGVVWGISGYVWAEDLLRDAHTAMYHAKALGKDRYEIFNTNMRVQVVTLLQLENDLRHAIERQEFRLHYQPLVSFKTGRIAGFEALIRWQHPQHGMVSPAKFIPVAEETGLIVTIGRWVFQEACQQLRIWHEKFRDRAPASLKPESLQSSDNLSNNLRELIPTLPPFTMPLMMSVNLSGKQFAAPNLLSQFDQILQETGVDAGCVKLEITESTLMGDTQAAIDLLLKLKSLNLKLCIDDFGTGYSSLSHLHQFPFDTLKVDQSFVNRIGKNGENTEIVRTIVTLAHDLGMDVIAEGIETSDHMTQLRAMHCEYGQGYLFAKPLDSEAIEALLMKDPHW